MNLSPEITAAKLETLREGEGFATLEDMLREATFDSISPGICIECDHTAEVEPDQERGWCENCGGNTVVSALILAGIV